MAMLLEKRKRFQEPFLEFYWFAGGGWSVGVLRLGNTRGDRAIGALPGMARKEQIPRDFRGLCGIAYPGTLVAILSRHG